MNNIIEHAETYWRELCPIPLPSSVAQWIEASVRGDAPLMEIKRDRVKYWTNWWFHEWTAINSGELEDESNRV